MSFPLSLALLLFINSTAQDQATTDLPTARAGHTTVLVNTERDASKPDVPPSALFASVQYPTSLGPMHAYLSQPELRTKEERSPAIIWLCGGLPVSDPGEFLWQPSSASNGQTASAYWQEGLVVLFPFLRGTHGNPGQQESFYGEVDDVLAARAYLGSLDYVDPKRIYLGGHSTGGTLALLVAESTPDFKAVIAMGPVADPAYYDQERLPYDPGSEQESRLRAPIYYLDAITSPTFVIEGQSGNLDSLKEMQAATKNPQLHFVPIDGASHLDALAPVNAFVAAHLSTLKADEPVQLPKAKLQAAFAEAKRTSIEVDALYTLANLRANGIDFDQPQVTRHYVSAWNFPELGQARKRDVWPEDWSLGLIEVNHTDADDTYFWFTATKTIDLTDLDEVFEAAWTASQVASLAGADYDGWDVE